MSTFVKIRPIEPSDTKTTAIRLDGDFELTVRTEKGGAHTDRQYNFSGLLEGQHVAETNDVASVRISKSGTDERAIVSVSTYHAAGDEGSIPPAGMYWYNWQTTDLKDAPDPAFQESTQVFTTIFNISTAGALPVGNSVASTVPARLYGQLGTTEARREFLKAKLLAHIDNRDLPFYLAGTSMPLITATSRNSIDQQDGTITEYARMARRNQSYMFFLESLTRAISNDDNLDSERKFNLLNGEISLPIGNVLGRIDLNLAGTIAGSNPRANWTYLRLGSVAAASPWGYTAPTDPTTWIATADTTISVGAGVPSDVLDWLGWLRS